jgi:Holliday junction resolvase RusA-like endonuclease
MIKPSDFNFDRLISHFNIDGQPRTKKNGMIRTKRGIIQSKAYREYEKSALWQLQAQKKKMNFKYAYDMGVKVTVLYYLQNRRSFPDLLGLLQATADILEKAGIVENDSFIAEFGESRIAGIDAVWPRAEITIERISDTMHPCYTTNPKLYKRAIAGEYDEWSDRK